MQTKSAAVSSMRWLLTEKTSSVSLALVDTRDDTCEDTGEDTGDDVGDDRGEDMMIDAKLD